MFIGHYAPGALGAATGKIKLWQAFVGAQLVDYAWGGLVLADVEHARIVPGFTQASALDLIHMPYTHSLGMAIIWALGAAFGFAVIFRKQALAGALVFGLVVLSHWFMDLIVHVQDLPLWFGTDKYGFGLWHKRALSFSFEVIIFVGAMLYYFKKTPITQPGRWARIAPFVVIVLMVLMQVFGNFGPPPKSMTEMVISAWFAYTLFALLAYSIDRTRS